MNMNIGVDFDGVIVDSERQFKYFFEKHAFFKYGQEPKTRAWRKIERDYDITEHEADQIFVEFLVSATHECGFMVGAREILDMLRERGHKLFLITARTSVYALGEEEIISAKKRLDEFGFKFDGEFWCVNNKVKVCKDNNIVIMIDDCNENCRKLSEAGIHTLYFREKGVEKLPGGKYLVDVYNWMHIYKEILKLEKGKK